MIDWKEHLCWMPKHKFSDDDTPQDLDIHRQHIEPWLSAIFQSEHMSLLTGNGLVAAITDVAGVSPPSMNRVGFSVLADKIKAEADRTAKIMGREVANIEDDFRTAFELLRGLEIQGHSDLKELQEDIDAKLLAFISQILETEKEFEKKVSGENSALTFLKSFLVSFASRTATRDRLNIFTTNYDRFIELGCDLAGIIILDRFSGQIQPEFRTTKLELDYHYNPPGIRGEPRYVEGVIRYTKLHGSIDWQFRDNKIVREPLKFGCDIAKAEWLKDKARQSAIYPNSAKDIETAFYPYAELFRDFSAALCRPNSILVTYGYGFGDSHINRVIEDMLKIPSTHVVIISFDDASGRIPRFVESNNESQFTLLLGKHFGSLNTLVDNYLPKSTIDRLSVREQKLREDRGGDRTVNNQQESALSISPPESTVS